jgi:predicted ABC-type ATPase
MKAYWVHAADSEHPGNASFLHVFCEEHLLSFRRLPWHDLRYYCQHCSMRPNVYIIAGPNGVGKTTFAREFLPNYADCKNFVNADLIAQGMAPFSPETAAFRAGRLVLNEIDLFAQRRADFGFETTLSGRSYLGLIRRLKDQGYAVHFFFLWVSAVDLALSRIEARVLQGGHDVPEADVRRRFDRSIKNFLESYRPLGDSWYLFDNSLRTPAAIALEEGGRLRIMKPDAYKALVAQYGKHD